jgi:hypothetical protein
LQCKEQVPLNKEKLKISFSALHEDLSIYITFDALLLNARPYHRKYIIKEGNKRA